MDKERIQEITGIITASIAVLAVLGGLAVKEWNAENILGAIQEIATFVVTISAVIFTSRQVIKSLDPVQRYLKFGSEALKAVQKKHPSFLIGPKYDREKQDEDNPGAAKRFLFIKKPGALLKSPFVSLDSLGTGALDIRVSGKTVQILEPQWKDWDQAQKKQKIEELQKAVHLAVEKFVSSKYKGYYDIEQVKNPRTAIMIDFDEEKLGYRKFKKAIIECCEIALKELGIPK